mmetsp:Transcript_50764/g.127351  ORF Transcript_50764/g.127351 Transcript_50764/m.127351 type:complete len:224 (-) Transcript_50764:395-1066(-)
MFGRWWVDCYPLAALLLLSWHRGIGRWQLLPWLAGCWCWWLCCRGRRRGLWRLAGWLVRRWLLWFWICFGVDWRFACIGGLWVGGWGCLRLGLGRIGQRRLLVALRLLFHGHDLLVIADLFATVCPQQTGGRTRWSGERLWRQLSIKMTNSGKEPSHLSVPGRRHGRGAPPGLHQPQRSHIIHEHILALKFSLSLFICTDILLNIRFGRVIGRRGLPVVKVVE